MDIQIQKLNIIHRLIRVTDEDLINKIDTLLSSNTEDISPMTLEEFYSKIDEAENDIANGNIISHDDLIKSVEKW
jgi:hypothetical protein